MTSRLDSPIAVLAATALLYGGFLYLHLANATWNPTVLVMAGKPVVEPDSLPAGFAILAGQAGYDGQYYYRLALDPLTDRPIAHGIRLDLPAYRQQRILYPVLARVLARGQDELIPWTLIAVNFIALLALGWLGGLYAIQLGVPAIWGLAFPLYIGFVTSLSRDLAEPVECALILGALLCVRRHRYWIAALLLSAAVLAKEPALLVAVGIALADLFTSRGRFSQRTRYVAALPVVVLAAWQFWLWRNWGTVGVIEGSANAGGPFSGITMALSGGLWHWHWPWGLALLVVVVTGVVCLFTLRGSRSTAAERAAAALYALLLISLSGNVWGDNHAFVRAASEFSLLAAILLLGSRAVWPRWILLTGSIAWLGAASQVM